jgi:hypothetical protein
MNKKKILFPAKFFSFFVFASQELPTSPLKNSLLALAITFFVSRHADERARDCSTFRRPRRAAQHPKDQLRRRLTWHIRSKMEEMDVIMIQLAQRSGGIEPLLHAVFSFLKRKTDFYHIQRKGDRVGFPPGRAKQLVLEAYERFESDSAAPPPAKHELEQRGERLLPDGRRASSLRPASSADGQASADGGNIKNEKGTSLSNTPAGQGGSADPKNDGGEGVSGAAGGGSTATAGEARKGRV